MDETPRWFKVRMKVGQDRFFPAGSTQFCRRKPDDRFVLFDGYRCWKTMSLREARTTLSTVRDAAGSPIYLDATYNATIEKRFDWELNR